MNDNPTSPPDNPALAEQLAELSAITGGLAHEIRNPLSTLKVNLQLLNEDWKSVEAVSGDTNVDARDVARRSRKRINTLLAEADRLERILSDFLKYVGKRDLKTSRQDLTILVRDLADFYQPQAQIHNIDLRVELRNAPLFCRVDGQFIKQAVLNLLLNGQQAMPDGGVLELSVRAEDDCWAKIDVRDHGPGIPPDRQEQIFQAYYSTKRGGTGLGLAMARQIVRDHGGRITLQSTPPNGATFSILLSRAAN